MKVKLERQTLQIRDVDAIVEKVSGVAYENACEVVSETAKTDLENINEYRSWAMDSGENSLWQASH